jgi:nitroreductase
MQTWDAITSRRNVRSFADRPIPPADLDRILEAGRRAPSSQNWQPWDFIVVTDRGQLRELARVWRGAGHVAGSAATIVVIGPAADNEFHRAQLDLGRWPAHCSASPLPPSATMAIPGPLMPAEFRRAVPRKRQVRWQISDEHYADFSGFLGRIGAWRRGCAGAAN